MSTDLPARVRAALDEHCAAADLAPPDLADVRRRAARTSRLAPIAVAAAVVLIVLAALVAPYLLANVHQAPANPTGTPSLPDQFAGISLLTGSVAASPPGPAIAYYSAWPDQNFGFGFSQPMTVSAYGDRYRRLTEADARGCIAADDLPIFGGYAKALLAPDGRWIAIGDGCGTYGDLEIVDLRGGSRRCPIAPDHAVRALAWSPDGRYVAYFVRPSADGVTSSGTLGLLDRQTGRTRQLSGYEQARVAAFRPDGQQLAVQDGSVIRILDLTGKQLRVLDPGRYRQLAGPQAWTPDGTTVITMPSDASTDPNIDYDPSGKQPQTYAFLGVDKPATLPALPQYAASEPILGWRSAQTYVVRGPSGNAPTNDDALVEVSIRTGQRSVLSTLRGDGYGLTHLQLAAGLVRKMVVRPAGDADRGPWPPWAITVAVIVAAALVGMVWLVRRLRRHPRKVGTDTVNG
jgi:hypothetical protein